MGHGEIGEGGDERKSEGERREEGGGSRMLLQENHRSEAKERIHILTL